MSRVPKSESTGAGIHVFSDDHCPPHVHALHRGQGWIARVGFSYVGRQAEFLSIAPVRNSPLRRTVNSLLADIEAGLAACRRKWWMTKRTTCLTNQWVLVGMAGVIEACAKPSSDAKQIGDAVYDPDAERLQVTFKDRTTLVVSTRQ